MTDLYLKPCPFCQCTAPAVAVVHGRVHPAGSPLEWVDELCQSLETAQNQLRRIPMIIDERDAARAQADALADVLDRFLAGSFRVFIVTRQRMHPEGVRMWDEAVTAARARLAAYREKTNGS